MPQITRRLEFDAGHRILGHEGKCRHLHGHRYAAEITVRTIALDGIGRVVDFGVIKSEVGEWIDESLDHNLLLNSDDSLVYVLHDQNERHPFLMPYGNPTAENIAQLIFEKSVELLAPWTELEVQHIRIYETPSCWADYP